MIRVIVFWGLYWSPPVLGNYHRHRSHALDSLKGLYAVWGVGSKLLKKDYTGDYTGEYDMGLLRGILAQTISQIEG